MIYNLLSYVIHLFRYHNFNLADIDQFSENDTYDGQGPRAYAFFKYSLKINQSSYTKYFDLTIMRINFPIYLM